MRNGFCTSDMGRRGFLRLCGAAAAAVAIPSPLLAALSGGGDPERAIALLNTHTGERLERVYWAGGNYLPGALRDVDRLLRDHRTGEVHRIDPRLLDQLHALAARLGPGAAFEVISGFRSPATNAALRRAGRGVARRSYHLSGKAVDVRLEGVALSDLHRAALALRRGGVGWYPGPDFVHLDTGPVRRW